MPDPTRVRFDDLPADLFGAAFTFLNDVLRECQLVNVAGLGATAVHPDLHELAGALVPDLEEVIGLLGRADLVADGATVNLSFEPTTTSASTMAVLQTRLAQLRFFGRRGDLLIEPDPAVSAFLGWMWDATADQLHGLRSRPYRPR
jgi:hypothetical protein